MVSMKRIFSKCKAEDLIKMGNTLIKTEINKYDSKKIVYLFEDNLKLRDDMTELNGAR
ncbi:MAG: hypothetical protein ACRCX2_14915 [Paraclostridium sp.]